MRFRTLLITLVVGVLLAGPAVAAGPAGAAAPVARPDGAIRLIDQTAYVGRGVFNTTGVGQTRERRIGERGRGIFVVRVDNEGAATDDFRLSGSSHSVKFSVQYRVGGVDVSAAVKAGTFVLRDLAPGEARTVTVIVSTRRSVRKGTTKVVWLRSRSMATSNVDAVRALVVRPLYSDDQVTVAGQINASRTSRGLSRLAMNRTLATKAQGWAQHLAAIGRLEHSDLTAGVPSNWRALAENVGYYTTLANVHQAFMDSPGHRANILGPYTFVGTGVARAGSRVYVVHVFMRT